MDNVKNRDFLFISDARLSNPNGNPDDENRHRMDYDTKTLLVSDVRKKRDVRDFMQSKGYEILIGTSNDKKVTLENRIKEFIDESESEEEKINSILEKAVDIRMFGSAMAVGGITRTFTGPIQLSWGYSLHPVDLVKASTITSIMSSNEDKEGNSTFGQMYKAEYAMIAHSGSVNKNAAKKTKLSEEDVSLFRRALVQSMMNNQTHSKQGQQPLLYLEVEYKPEFDGFLGDLRRYLDVTHKESAIRSSDDITVDFKRLTEVLGSWKDYIEAVHIWQSPIRTKFINLPQNDETVNLLEPITDKKD